MKILVVGINPWVDNTGINTLINFFSDCEKENLALVYTREGLPNTKICDNFFRISESKLIKSIFNRKIIAGQRVFNDENSKIEKTGLYKSKPNDFKYLARELIWKAGRWKTKELHAFLDEFNPDLLFFPTYSSAYMSILQNYIASYTKKPFVLYASDDNYSYKSVNKNPISLLMRKEQRKWQRKLFAKAKEVMVISPKQKEEYDKLFNVNCVVMTKGIDYSNLDYQEKEVSEPIKMVYTGKLIIGRWHSLYLIVKALKEINKDKNLIELDIYTTDKLTKKQQKLLNTDYSFVKGAISLEQTKIVQRQADILVFVEGLQAKYKNKARLSFSTKITDYLSQGKCIFAVGDKNIAPIDYFIRYDSGICATNKEEIGLKLKEIVNDKSLITKYGKKAFDCGKIHHEKQQNKEIFKNVLSRTVENEFN